MKKGIKILKWLLVFFLLCLIGLGLLFYFQFENDFGKNFKRIKLDGIDQLMIVAHPDDESIWGGGHLLTEKYLVVCITCGDKHNRVLEFKEAMNNSESPYLMLNYVDKSKAMNKPDFWLTHVDEIKKDLTKIMKLKKWKKVVTHNPDGEYGHLQHKLTDRMVTQVYQTVYGDLTNLYYFGKYYRPSKIASVKDQLVQLDPKLLKEKEEKLLRVYKSQKFIYKSFGHMFPYENWVNAPKWQYPNRPVVF